MHSPHPHTNQSQGCSLSLTLSEPLAEMLHFCFHFIAPCHHISPFNAVTLSTHFAFFSFCPHVIWRESFSHNNMLPLDPACDLLSAHSLFTQTPSTRSHNFPVLLRDTDSLTQFLQKKTQGETQGDKGRDPGMPQPCDVRVTPFLQHFFLFPVTK